jgi:hypothetical protein
MNTLYLPLVVLVTACALGGCSRDADEAPAGLPAAAPAPGDDAPGVTADADTQRGLDIELAEVRSTSVGVQLRGTATVVDSAAFAASMADLDSLRAEAAVAADDEKRIEGLYRDDGNASRQAVNAARQQRSSVSARLAGAESRARVDWGARLAHPDDAASAKFRSDVASGAVTLFRAEFSDALDSASSLHYELLSSHHDPVTLEFFDRSRATAQFAAGDSVLLGLRASRAPDATFRPGERVSIVATADGAARPQVPAEAAIAYQGRMWCYVARGADRFDRVAIDATEGGIKVGDRVVVHGVALLLSLERSAGAEAGAGEEE